MRTYGMGYQEVMSMPVRAFWTVSGFVERVVADESKRTLEIQTASHNGESAATLYERLDKQAPAPVKFTGHAIASFGAERDEDGFAQLKALAG